MLQRLLIKKRMWILILLLGSLTNILAAQADIAIITAPSGASLRSEPATTSLKLAAIPYLSEVVVLENTLDNQTIEGITGPWYRISHNKKEGYVFSGLISSNPEEMRLIKSLSKNVERTMLKLVIKAENGKTIVFENDPSYGESSKSYLLKDYLEAFHLYVIEESGWDWGNIILVSALNATMVEVGGIPVFSPDNQKFISVKHDPEDYGSGSRIQVYSFIDGIFNLEWSHEPKEWGPTSAKWLSDKTIELSMSYFDGKEDLSNLEYDGTKKQWYIAGGAALTTQPAIVVVPDNKQLPNPTIDLTQVKNASATTKLDPKGSVKKKDPNALEIIVPLLIILFVLSVIWILFTSFYKEIKKILFVGFCAALFFRLVNPILYGTDFIWGNSKNAFYLWLSTFPQWEALYLKIWFSIGFVWCVFAVYVRKCSKCQSFAYKETNREVINRFTEPRQRSERYDNGKYEKIFEWNVQVTLYNVDYQCKNCGHVWCEEQRSESAGQERLVSNTRVS